MDTTYCNITGGWMRLAYFNMSEPGASCPTSLLQINKPAKLCGCTHRGCSGVTFPTDGIRYSKVCGQARGYQYYSISAFGESANNINSTYVEGVSIMYGSPRHHLWTYVHMPLGSLMMTIMEMESTTVPVPHPQVENLLILLGWITTANLE